MKRLALLLALLFIAATASAADVEDAAIVEVVDRAYVHGVHIDADPEKMRSGMHDTFVMFVPSAESGVTQLSRDAWIGRLTAGKGRPDTKADIKVLDRAGNAAVAKVDLFRDGKQIFTDYISLYKVGGEWKLVGKVFHRH